MQYSAERIVIILFELIKSALQNAFAVFKTSYGNCASAPLREILLCRILMFKGITHESVPCTYLAVAHSGGATNTCDLHLKIEGNPNDDVCGW